MADPTVACPRCRHANPARAKFCLECGQRLALICAGAGALYIAELVDWRSAYLAMAALMLLAAALAKKRLQLKGDR